MKKIVSAILALTMLAALLTACGTKAPVDSGSASASASAPAAQETLTLRYGHTDTETSITGRQAQLFADKVNAACGGRVKIEVYPLGQMGTSAEMVSGVQTGTVDITFLTMAMIGNLCDEFAALDTPYLFDSIDECVKVCATGTDTMNYLTQKLYDTTGIKYLFSFYFGTRETTANKPIYSPDDMKGLKFRSMNFPFYLSYYQALGAIPTPIDITELPQALQTGEIEGQENPVDVILSRQMYENQKYLILTNHMTCCQGVVMNGNTWNKISPEDQATIMECAKETVAESNAYAMNLAAEQTKQLTEEYGMTLIDETNGLDIDAFKTLVDDYIEANFGEKYAEVYKLVAQDKAA